MSGRLDTLVAELRPFAKALVDEAANAGLNPQVTSTFRTYAEQKALYERFLRGQSAYPASPPGEGSHEYGWAFDMVVNQMDTLADLGDLWESWGGRWGGNWRNPDVIHFELAGASEEARRRAGVGQSPQQHSLAQKGLAAAADILLGMIPGIGEVELAANLYSLGYPKSKIAQFLGGPVSYFFP